MPHQRIEDLKRFYSMLDDLRQRLGIEALLDSSASDQQEVTDQLGYQVRTAVEVLIQALDKADLDHGRQLLAGVDEKDQGWRNTRNQK